MADEKNHEHNGEHPVESEFDNDESEEVLDDPAPTEEEWARRVLCSDESCIGVIGPDGRCKECGKPYEGELPDVETVMDKADTDSEPAPEPKPEKAMTEESDEEDDDDWSKRKLCSDGNCIGVIGPDGKCKECGKPYTGNPT